jgi:formylglycine-generating enzyme required for sulfatase activity
MPRALIRAVTACCALLVAGCGSDGSLQEAADRQFGTYAIIDLDTGETTYRADATALGRPEAIRDRFLVLRRLPSGTYPTGIPTGSGIAGDADEAPSTERVGMIFIGIFECTRAQWQRLGGEPVTGDGRPQTGATLPEIRSRLAALSQRVGRGIRLPTDAEWEAAARATDSGGDAGVKPATGKAALVRESALLGSTPVSGPQTVGSRAPTGLGFYDLIGNVWEWTATGATEGLDVNGFAHLRGGSWSDTLATARASNLVQIDPNCTHPDVGFRVVMEP